VGATNLYAVENIEALDDRRRWRVRLLGMRDALRSMANQFECGRPSSGDWSHATGVVGELRSMIAQWRGQGPPASLTYQEQVVVADVLELMTVIVRRVQPQGLLD
jgi:hypothetical protein